MDLIVEAVMASTADERARIYTCMMTNPGGRHCRAFLCYASIDRERVRTLYDRLRSDDLDVWFDVESLLPGQDWKAEIADAISRCDVFIACLSRASVNSRGYFHKELKLALDVLDTLPDKNTFLIPVRLDDCEVPTPLSHRQRVDFFGGVTDGIDRIVRSIAEFAARSDSSHTGNDALFGESRNDLANFSTRPDLTYLNSSNETSAVDEIIGLLEIELDQPAARNVRLRLASGEIQPLNAFDEHVAVNAAYTFSTSLVALCIRFLHRNYAAESGLEMKLIRLVRLRRAGFTRSVHLVAAIVGLEGDFDPEWTRNHTSAPPGLERYYVRYYQMRGAQSSRSKRSIDE